MRNKEKKIVHTANYPIKIFIYANTTIKNIGKFFVITVLEK